MTVLQSHCSIVSFGKDYSTVNGQIKDSTSMTTFSICGTSLPNHCLILSFAKICQLLIVKSPPAFY